MAQDVADIPASEVQVSEDPANNKATINGITFDTETGVVEGIDALDVAREEAAADPLIAVRSLANEISVYAVPQLSLADLKNTKAETDLVNIEAIEGSNGNLVCKLTPKADNPDGYINLKTALAKSFFDAGSKLLNVLLGVIPVAGDIIGKLVEKIGGKVAWSVIEGMVKSFGNKPEEWNLTKAQNMAITSLENKDVVIDLDNAETRKKVLAGFLSFADKVFGKGAETILKLFNIAVTIAGVAGVPGVSGLKLDETKQKEILGSFMAIRNASEDLAEANQDIGETCSNLLTNRAIAPVTSSATTSAEPTATPDHVW